MKEQAGAEERKFISEEQANAVLLWYLDEMLGRKDKGYPVVKHKIEVGPEASFAKEELHQLLSGRTTDSARVAIRELGIVLYKTLTGHSERTNISFRLDGYPAIQTYNPYVSQKLSGIIQQMIDGHFRTPESLKDALDSQEQVGDIPEPKGTVQNVSRLKEDNVLEARNILDPEAVIKALTDKGLEIRLTREEEARFQQIPFSEGTLKMASSARWRGKKAILWWAPPERCGVTIRKLIELFGTSRSTPPYIYYHNWSLKEKDAREVLREGWHLNLAEIPPDSSNRDYEEQKALTTEEEELPAPVEVLYLCLVNYLVNDKKQLLPDCNSRTNALDSNDYVVTVGSCGAGGYEIFSSSPDGRYTGVGVLLSRKSG